MSGRLTALLGCELPVQQAGMAAIAGERLAVSVARAGAVGMLGASGVAPEVLTQVLDRVARMTADSPGVVGVNFLVPFFDLEALEVVASHARLVEWFYGDPEPDWVSRAHEAGALTCWQVGSAEEARRAEQAGCNLIVAQGVEAGGHVRGKIGLLPLLEAVLEAVTVPVMAAGGLGSGRSVAAALAAGADGVRLGTVFLAAEEADVHPSYQEALWGASAEDTVLTTSYSVGWPDAPHRVLRSCLEALTQVEGEVAGEAELGGVRVPVPRASVLPPTASATGAVEAMALYAGESVGAVRRRRPAGQIIRDIWDEACAALRETAERIGGSRPVP